MSAAQIDCVLCREAGGLPVWQGAQLRVIRAQEEGFPAFYRVIWMAHVVELSDLSEADRNTCMAVVAAVAKAATPKAVARAVRTAVAKPAPKATAKAAATVAVTASAVVANAVSAMSAQNAETARAATARCP